MAHGLRRDRATEAQFGLTPEARQQNLADAFCVDQRFSKRELSRTETSRTVLLVDDIYTTGTTARSAVQVLRQSGISVGGILAVAKAVQNV
jgi:predicted amidophosphoribosyltransferase